MSASQVKIGIVGIGGMGRAHVRHVRDLPNTALAAICDSDPARLAASDAPSEVPRFLDYEQMLASADLQGVLIATPHYFHPDMSLQAFARGLHVLVEKPIAVHVQEAQRMIAGYQAAKAAQPNLIFAAMFMQRTWGHWRKIKDLLAGGALGKLLRCTWIITDWFRAQSYYDSGDWRASWSGEGGGVLMNQSPHNIDLYQWLLGMPARIHGFASFGKHHRIEVEDEVSAFFEHENGMIGHFITSTGESPGSNRLEISGEHGKLIYEDGVITFFRNEWSSIQQIWQSPAGFDKVPCQRETVAYSGLREGGHDRVIANFADAILHGAPLIAPAEEGIHQLTLSNGIILAAHSRQAVELPLDAAAYAALLAAYRQKPPQ